jgi:peroxiredoxin Q/BCP
MIDLPKATKGRHMSKITRKKSPKPSSRTASPARSAKSAKSPPTQTRPIMAGNSGRNVTRKTRNATLEASNDPSKGLKATDTSPARKPGLAEGSKAPAFQLPRDGGGTVSLSDFSGKKLVLFFYPRADTPGCTKEAIDFTRLAKSFAEHQTAILGVSSDPPRAQEAFRSKHRLVTPLASDETHEMLEAYGVWGEKSMYGKTFQGILRTTVLIGTDGRIVKIWRKVKVDGHADDVLAAAQAI